MAQSAEAQLMGPDGFIIDGADSEEHFRGFEGVVKLQHAKTVVLVATNRSGALTRCEKTPTGGHEVGLYPMAPDEAVAL